MANDINVYIAPDASGLNFHQAVGDKRVFVKFIDGNYRTADAELAAALDEAIAEGHISRWVRKVDMAAAERLVHEHAARRAATGAQTGQQTSQSTANLNVLQARDQELHRLPDPDAVIDKLAEESDLVVTIAGAAPVVAEGAKPATGISFPSKKEGS